jgi:hypothetical protein
MRARMGLMTQMQRKGWSGFIWADAYLFGRL